MEPAYNNFQDKYITLKQAADVLSVTVTTLLEWNENNILKPTITPDGEVGYRQDQINKFLAIQNLTNKNTAAYEKQDVIKPYQSFAPQIPFSTNTSFSKPVETPTAYPPEMSLIPTGNLKNQTGNIITQSKEFKTSNKKTGKFLKLGIITTFSAMTTFAAVFLFTKITIFQPLPKNTSLSEVKNRQSDFNYPVQGNKPENGINKNIAKYPDNVLSVSTEIFNNAAEATEAATSNPNTYVPILARKDGSDILADITVDAYDINNTELSNFSSRPNCPNCSKDMESDVFDESGNIKGEKTTSDLLATSLGTAAIIQGGNSLKQTMDLNILLVFLTLGSLSFVFIFKRHPAYAPEKSATIIAATDKVTDVNKEKVLEIDQKTDGAVMLYFQGKGYKISKPELNSESDQFIERLLGFTADGAKEISYDILRDEKIKLNAPLSKIVTRLGFVGLKRDLFFPRTSKHRVLFRKYLTGEDLDSMGLTTEQITNQLLN